MRQSVSRCNYPSDKKECGRPGRPPLQTGDIRIVARVTVSQWSCGISGEKGKGVSRAEPLDPFLTHTDPARGLLPHAGVSNQRSRMKNQLRFYGMKN